MENSTQPQESQESQDPQELQEEQDVQDVQVSQADLDLEKQRQAEMDAHICGAIEALLFVCEKPITLEQLKNTLETVNSSQVKRAIATLQDIYDERNGGMTIMEIAGGYQMLSNATYATYVRSFYKTKKKEKLSRPALECLAIIAYKQPMTRSDIEVIRGVNSDGVVAHLLNKELIKIVGRKEVPGRPYTYGSTKKFLEYFGLKSLANLPKLEEMASLQSSEEKNPSAVDESVVEKNVDEVVAQVQQDATQEEPSSELLSDDIDAVEFNAVEETGEEGSVPEETMESDVEKELLPSVDDEEIQALSDALEELEESELAEDLEADSKDVEALSDGIESFEQDDADDNDLDVPEADEESFDDENPLDPREIKHES